MSELVDDLLMLAQLEDAPVPHAEPVDLSVMAIELVSDAHATAPDHLWRLSLPDEPVTMEGDARQLRQMLLNLIANAALHTPAGTTVLISLSIDPARHEVLIAVSDDGPGIPAADLPHVFERFRRVGGEAGSTGRGSGLGLAIVAAAARAHRGHVEVRSETGSTTFRVALAADAARST
jgi:two-component system OmpR family sensor kinase